MNLIAAYDRDKTSYKDDCFNLTNELNKDDNFFDPNSSKTQPSSSSYLAPERINLVEPQKMEQSGFVGEAGEVSYDEGLSWHPIQPINENDDTGISSFDPLDVSSSGGRRGILRNSGRRDPEGNVTNVVDCDIDGRNDEIVSLDYLDNIHEVQGNFPDLKNTRGEGHEMENGFAGMVDNLLMDTNLNQSYFQGPTENNVQGKMRFEIISLRRVDLK